MGALEVSTKQISIPPRVKHLNQVLVAASPAHKELDHFVHQKESEGKSDADQPLIASDLSQFQETLEKIELDRQDDHQQRNSIEHKLAPVMPMAKPIMTTCLFMIRELGLIPLPDIFSQYSYTSR
jgi:hypothetical protein